MQTQKPTCTQCGGADLALEVIAHWNDATGRAETSEICDKGHYCNDCDGETRLVWVDADATITASMLGEGHGEATFKQRDEGVFYLDISNAAAAYNVALQMDAEGGMELRVYPYNGAELWDAPHEIFHVDGADVAKLNAEAGEQA